MKSKIPLYIAIVVAVFIIAASGYYFLSEEPPIKLAPTPIPTPVLTPAATVTPAITPAVVLAEVVKCEICHVDAQNIVIHKNGGQFCANCHGNKTHDIHIGPGTVNLQCEPCHGFPPVIPTAEKGHVVCENCHAPPPDSLKASGGDIVAIHLSRQKYCTVCHNANIATIHKTAKAGNQT